MSLQQLQRGAAVFAQDAVKLDQVHRRVQRDAQPVLVGGAAGRLEQLDRAGVELGRVEHAAHAAMVRAVVLAREGDRALEAGQTDAGSGSH